MKKYIINTNVLISYVTDRHPDQQDRIGGLFQKVAKLTAAILCPQNVLTEFIYVLDKVYDVSKPDIRMMVKDFLAMPGPEFGLIRTAFDGKPEFQTHKTLSKRPTKPRKRPSIRGYLGQQ